MPDLKPPAEEAVPDPELFSAVPVALLLLEELPLVEVLPLDVLPLVPLLLLPLL